MFAVCNVCFSFQITLAAYITKWTLNQVIMVNVVTTLITVVHYIECNKYLRT